MKTISPPQLDHDQPSPIGRSAPLPMSPRTVYAGLKYYAALYTGWINDPWRTLRAAGEIFLGVPPNFAGPLRPAMTESFIDGWNGRSVFINSPRLVRELHSRAVDHEAFKKFLLFLMGNQTPFLLRGREHVRVRRALAAELTPAQVERYRQRSVERLDEMIDELPLDAPVELHDFYTRFTQDIILRVVFGWDDCRDLDELKTALYQASRHYARPSARLMAGFLVNAAISLRRRGGPFDLSQRNDRLSPLLARRGFRLQTRADELVYRKILELRERPNDSITARLIDYAAHETPAWTDKRLRDIIVTLLIAGHETSVVAYAWATQYLLHNPHPRAELVAEAREARTDRYAHACNTEALRMQSPVIGTLPFPLTEDIALGGYRIPRSTMVFAAASALHHDEDLYPEPEAFRPERWFQTTPDRYGYIPFGVGVHRCPGSTFYFTEAAILLHRLFGRLDLEPCDPSVDPARFIFGVVARPRGNTRVIVRQRRNAEDVPSYRPVENEKPSPLKQALLPDPPETAEPAHCPFAPDSHTSGEG